MNSNIYERKNSSSFRNKAEESNSTLKLNGSRILNPSVDKNKMFYRQKKTIEIFKNNNNKQNNQLLTISNENLPSYKKLPLLKRNNDKNIAIKNQYKSNKNIYYKDINNNFNSNDNNSKLYMKTDDNNSLDVLKRNNKRENFAFLHEIKKIKKKVDLLHKDNSIKNIMNNKVAFDENNSKVALKPIKIINNFKDLKESEVMNKNSNLFSFLTEKTKISRKNVLIKLLLEQKETYDKTIDTHQKHLTEMKKNIETDETDFQTLVQNQKYSSRKIEELLEQLLLRKRNLLIEQYNLNSEIRIKQDERQKLLEHINEYRIIAKFLTKALGGKAKLFEFTLTTIENNGNDYEYIYEKEIQKVLQRFGFLLNYDKNLCYVNQDDIDIFNEITSLNYSDMLFHQLWKREDSILKNLRKNEMLNKEIVNFHENEESKISYLKNKIESLEKELKYNQDIYELEKKEYDKIYKKRYEKNTELEDIIFDFYNFIFNDNNKKSAIDKGNRRNTIVLDVEDYILALNEAIIAKENLMNKVKFEFERCENEDKLFFNRVVNNVKTKNKQIHVNNLKKLTESGDHNRFKLLKIPKEKIILKYKKSEPPYYLYKKEKKVKVDPELIKQIENEELLTYE